MDKRKTIKLNARNTETFERLQLLYKLSGKYRSVANPRDLMWYLLELGKTHMAQEWRELHETEGDPPDNLEDLKDAVAAELRPFELVPRGFEDLYERQRISNINAATGNS